jgi:hypothetical protein
LNYLCYIWQKRSIDDYATDFRRLEAHQSWSRTYHKIARHYYWQEVAIDFASMPKSIVTDRDSKFA